MRFLKRALRKYFVPQIKSYERGDLAIGMKSASNETALVQATTFELSLLHLKLLKC
jgi:hypothetical protein